MRLISACVDGIHQATERGLFDWLKEQDAEIICLQDLRAQAPELEDGPAFQLDGYFSYFFDSPTPQTNGVAIYTRQAPKAIMFGFGLTSGEDMDGRYLQADFDHTSVACLLAPHGSEDAATREMKTRFFSGLQNQMLKITRKRRNYIFCGNWQMAHRDIDVQNAESHSDESGFLAEERQWLEQLYNDIGYADAFRISNSDNDEFSWWPSGDMGSGDAWRTDTQVISKALVNQVEYAVLYKAKVFSSHTPVIIDYDLHEL